MHIIAHLASKVMNINNYPRNYMDMQLNSLTVLMCMHEKTFRYQ